MNKIEKAKCMSLAHLIRGNEILTRMVIGKIGKTRSRKTKIDVATKDWTGMALEMMNEIRNREEWRRILFQLQIVDAT